MTRCGRPGFVKALTNSVLGDGELYDALVTGSGAAGTGIFEMVMTAGTSGAMGLARVVLFDPQEYRFAPTLALRNTVSCMSSRTVVLIPDDLRLSLGFINYGSELDKYLDVQKMYRNQLCRECWERKLHPIYCQQ
jgi:hypothetical protein